MSTPQAAKGSRDEIRAEPSGSASPVWWLVFKQELAELWVSGRVFNFLILFSVLMSITAFLLATNNELSLTPVRQTVVVTLQAAITFGLFIGLIIAAESVSGERERATLETLLLTPTGHRQIVFGKFLAALSPWPVAFFLSIPYIAVLSRGDEVLVPALLSGALMGSVLAIAFTGFGMLVSIWSSSNRISLFVSLLVYILLLIPAQLPTEFQATPAGILIAATDPVEATRQFLIRALINSQPLGEVWILLVAPAVLTAIILGLLFLYAAPRLSLEGGRVSKRRRIGRQAEAIE